MQIRPHKRGRKISGTLIIFSRTVKPARTSGSSAGIAYYYHQIENVHHGLRAHAAAVACIIHARDAIICISMSPSVPP